MVSEVETTERVESLRRLSVFLSVAGNRLILLRDRRDTTRSGSASCVASRSVSAWIDAATICSSERATEPTDWRSDGRLSEHDAELRAMQRRSRSRSS